MKIDIKNKKGITLTALVITVVVLIILSGLTITAVTGENGILNKADTTKAKVEKREEEEQLQIMLNTYAENELTTQETLIEYLTAKKEAGELESIEGQEGDLQINVKVRQYTFKVDTKEYLVIEE